MSKRYTKAYCAKYSKTWTGTLADDSADYVYTPRATDPTAVRDAIIAASYARQGAAYLVKRKVFNGLFK